MVPRIFYDFASRVQNAVSTPDPTVVNRWEKAVLRQMGATSYRMATPQYDKSLLDMTSEVYRAYGISEPQRVIVYEQKYPNAAYLRMSNTMIISTSLLEALNENELRAVLSPENARMVKGVIGHEIGHRTQRDFLTVFAFGFTALSVIASNFLANRIKKPTIAYLTRKAEGMQEETTLKKGMMKFAEVMRQAPWAVATVFGLASAAVGWVLGFPSAAIQRKLELDADRKAAEKLGDPEALAMALEKISLHAHKARKEQILPTDMAARDQGLTPQPPPPEAPPTGWQKTLMEAKASHPKVSERIAILRSMAQKKPERTAILREIERREQGAGAEATRA